ncbi:MAG TPA: HAD family hydrolase [Gemmatimonadales bacterium]|nr:HAD family hydrolase [Gemmatimonadales bacterium]
MLFDFGGTLDADGVHWSPRFHAAYRAAGGTLPFAAFDPIFKSSDDALARLPGIRGLGFRAAIEAQARLLVGRLPDPVDPAAVARRLHQEAVAVVTRNVPVLERLARRYRLGIVSNFTGNLQPCLDELGLARFFGTVSDSGVVGWTKPDPRIFTHTLTALGVPPASAWMVGDNFEADIRGAAVVGMRTCWLAPPDRAAPSGLAPTARIGRLPEIESVLVTCTD